MKYDVIYPIRHNGTRHEPPAVIEMDEQDAAPHLAAGVLSPVVDVATVETEEVEADEQPAKPKKRSNKEADK